MELQRRCQAIATIQLEIVVVEETAHSMKIAVLCVGYLGQARGVELLAEYFAATDADIWLHVDVSTDATEYEALLARNPRIHSVTPRLRCWWGGFNGARAVLHAAALAQASQRYDRYLYLTEDSIPLRPLSELLERLAADREFINAGDGQAVRARYDGFYCWDCDAMCPRCATFEDWVVTPEMEIQVARLASLRARGKYKVSQLRHGEAYWGLSPGAIHQLLERHTTDNHFRESFEFSRIPEEQYYHTILAEAGCVSRTAPFMAMDFSKDPKPFVYRHRDELCEVRTHPHLFARKMALDAADMTAFITELAHG